MRRETARMLVNATPDAEVEVSIYRFDRRQTDPK